MAQASSGFKAFLTQKCPRCRTGKVFRYPSYHLKFTDMHELCPACGYKFEIEPGFFWGSMYISYAYSIGISLVTGFIVYFLLGDPDVWTYVAIIGGVLFLLSPLLFRYARLLMIHLFSSVRYDPSSIKKPH